MKYYSRFIILLIIGFILTFYESQFSQSIPPFDFIDQFDVSGGEDVISNIVTISGLEKESNISISGGAYSINNNDFTTESGMVNNEDKVRIMLTASGDYGKVTSSELMIGDFNTTFSVRTKDSPDSGW